LDDVQLLQKCTKDHLHGHKLKGDFILIKFKEDKYEGGWRLIKVMTSMLQKKIS
jgi:hypothetical protein